MSKLDDLKAKFSQALAGIGGKFAPILSKLPFFRKRMAPTPVSPDEKARSPDNGIGAVYREGDSVTRLAVCFVILLFAGFLYFTGNVAHTIWSRYSKNPAYRQTEQEYTSKLSKEREKVNTLGAVVGIGHIATDAVHPDGHSAYLNVDIWLICDNPETARYMEDAGLKAHNVIIDVFRALYDAKISPISDEGKRRAKNDIILGINKILPHGSIKDVNFYNLVIE